MAEYIKREDAERALLERCKETGYGGLTPDDIRLVMRTPFRIPTADVVERKRGKWVEDEDGCVCCSLCWNPCEINGITGEFLYSPYCSECGAGMRGDDDGI